MEIRNDFIFDTLFELVKSEAVQNYNTMTFTGKGSPLHSLCKSKYTRAIYVCSNVFGFEGLSEIMDAIEEDPERDLPF